MSGEVKSGRPLDVRLLPRPGVLLVSLLSIMVWFQGPVHAQVEIDALLQEEDLDAGRGHSSIMGELEASMRSSLLQDFQEETNKVQTPAAFPDSSAVVGRVFQMKVPNKMEDVYLGDIIKLSLHGVLTHSHR